MSRAKPKPGPFGVWLKAGTTMNDPYPCLCARLRSCRSTCDCRGRTDIDHLPRYCCAKPKPAPRSDP